MRGFLLMLALLCCFQTAHSQQINKKGGIYVGTELSRLFFESSMVIETGYGFSEHLSVECLTVLPFAKVGIRNSYEKEHYEEFENADLKNESAGMLLEAGFKYWTSTPYKGCHVGAYMSYMASGVPGMRVEAGYMMPIFKMLRGGVSASYLYGKSLQSPLRVRFVMGVMF